MLDSLSLLTVDTKTLIKRLYYALTGAVFFIVLLTFFTPTFGGVYNRVFFYLDIGVYGGIFTFIVAIYCWIMTRNNGRVLWKWVACAIPVILLGIQSVGIKILTATARNNQEFINISALNKVFFGALILYVAIVTFYSKTKYDYKHILPHQTKVGTYIFQGLYIIIQIILWGLFIMILPAFVDYWIGWWPTEEWVHDAINQMNAEFDQYF